MSDFDAMIQPLIDRVAARAVEVALDRQAREDALFQKRLAFSEGEAAALLGVARHVLRDERAKGRIRARLVGKSYRYSVETLKAYLRDVKG